MSYATYDQLEDHFGEKRLAQAVPSNTQDPEGYWSRRLSAESAMVDGYLARGGYTVPVDLSAIADATARQQLTDLLAHVVMVFAVHGAAILTNIPKALAEERKRLLAWLEAVAAGSIGLAAPLSAEEVQAFGIVGDTKLEPSNDLFELSRAFGGET